MEILRFLIVEQQDKLKEAITSLDNFPPNPIFNELRDVHSSIKYNGREFSVIEEIEHFLKVDKRKIEGLLTLKEHVSQNRTKLVLCV